MTDIPVTGMLKRMHFLTTKLIVTGTHLVLQSTNIFLHDTDVYDMLAANIDY